MGGTGLSCLNSYFCKLLALATSATLTLVQMFNLWLLAAGIVKLLCSQLVFMEVINSTERENVIVCEVLSMVLM